MSRTFVDVAVVRIGQYVTQVPKLKGIRGSSRMISQATDEAALIAELQQMGFRGVTPNPDVGQADGVVHLEIQSKSGAPVAAVPSDETAPSARGSASGANGTKGPHEAPIAEQVATAVLTLLRRELVGAHLGASWSEAVDYSTARLEMDRAEHGEGNLEWLPAPSEVPFLAPCTSCGTRPAHGTDRNGVCDDCHQRNELGRLSNSEQSNRPTGSLPVEFVGAELSSLTLHGTGTPADNHIALVSADGNGIGALFEALIKDPNITGEDRSTISRGLADASRAAFDRATDAVREPDLPARVVPVICGGDDLSVFVGADIAWRFTTTLLREFEDRSHDLISATLGDRAGNIPVPTMSAGLVFHKTKYPAAQAFVAAEQLMRFSKRIAATDGAAVSWRDVTSHGLPTQTGAADTRTAIPVVALTQRDSDLSALSDAKPSTLKQLTGRLAEWSELGMDSAMNSLLRQQAKRVGIESLISPFETDRISLSEALDLTRWWPNDA